jgi:6-phosphogluconolactonase (cycloisomerase 2 family)
MFTVGADGALTLVNPKFPAGSRPRAPLAFAAGTPYAYLTNTSSNNVTAYSADAATGALTQLSGSPTPAGTYPNSLTAHPDGKALYVLNNSSNDVSSYAIGSNGTLSKLWTGNVAAPQSPYAIVITP